MRRAVTPKRAVRSGTRVIGRFAIREPALLALTVSSGVVDAISFIALGKIFTAFISGNVVFLGLGAASAFGSGAPNLLRAGVALVSFAIGAFVAEEILKQFRGSRIWPQGFAFALTGVLLAQVAFMVGWMVVSGYPSETFATCLAATSAVAMGIQSATAGSLGLRGVFTTAVTATVMYLSSDAADRSPFLAEPARLAALLVCLLVGATAGGLLLVKARTYAPLVPPLATTLAMAGARMSRQGREAVRPRAAP